MDCYGTWTIGFATAPWSKISEISEAGNAAEVFAIGDKRTISCNGKTYEMEIVAFNQDNKADGSGKAGITCVCTDVYASTSKYYSSNAKIGWTDSLVRTLCNDTIYNGFDTDLKSVIKQVTKLSMFSNPISTNDHCWVLSAGEIGKTLYGGLASKYPRFSSLSDALIGKNFWLRDSSSTSNYAYYMQASTDNTKTTYMTSAFYVRFGFCI